MSKETLYKSSPMTKKSDRSVSYTEEKVVTIKQTVVLHISTLKSKQESIEKAIQQTEGDKVVRIAKFDETISTLNKQLQFIKDQIKKAKELGVTE